MSGDYAGALIEWEAATDSLHPASHPSLTPGGAAISHPDRDDHSQGGAAPNLATSFIPVDVSAVLAGDFEQPSPTLLWRRGDSILSALIYPGMVNGLHGDSGTGKSWVAIALLAERLGEGETVILLDLEDTAPSIVARLRLVGVTDIQMSTQLIYIRPTEPSGPVEVAYVATVIVERSVSVVVIDSLGEAFGTEGINEYRDNEVGPWLRGVARVLADAGPAVVLIDHSTKANDNPLHPSGSKRKRAAIGGASYLVEAVTGFTKGQSGRLKLTCAKDRHGHYRRGEHVAWVDMSTHPDGTVTLELLAPAPEQFQDRDDLVVRRIVRVLEGAGSASVRQLRALVRESKLRVGNPALDNCIELALLRGDIVEAAGPNRSRLFSIPSVEVLS